MRQAVGFPFSSSRVHKGHEFLGSSIENVSLLGFPWMLALWCMKFPHFLHRNDWLYYELSFLKPRYKLQADSWPEIRRVLGKKVVKQFPLDMPHCLIQINTLSAAKVRGISIRNWSKTEWQAWWAAIRPHPPPLLTHWQSLPKRPSYHSTLLPIPERAQKEE